MKKTPRIYEADELVVEYDVTRCIHVEACVRGLPTVFDPSRRPWIAPGRATAEAVAQVVRRCPTGALHYRRPGGAPESPPQRTEVRPEPDGPLYVHGRLRIRLPAGETQVETRVALCRCGESANKPYCDGAHEAASFADAATNVPARLATGTSEDSEVAVSFAPDGPILVDGPVTVRGADASETTGRRGALCRCGGSETKPFCDGRHKTVGFRAD
ncbi:MAG: hypothetical protein F4057_00095 [Acidobacteria bacterium]|nr:hypothetical protein [Acidobacteriota bacterium]MYI73784.1 hypothetical protein [Acidobacteriota bacterium]